LSIQVGGPGGELNARALAQPGSRSSALPAEGAASRADNRVESAARCDIAGCVVGCVSVTSGRSRLVMGLRFSGAPAAARNKTSRRASSR
jgi:hypothetical protein